MPEGDSLRRAAATIRPVLMGEPLTDAWFKKLRGHRPRQGDLVTEVTAAGKYLVVSFDRELDLITHLGMSGSWRAQSLDRPVPRSPKLRVVLATERGRALCFAAPTIETHIRRAGTSPVGRLGPDLSDDEVDIDEIVQRSRAGSQSRTVSDLLLDQHVAAGVGNVFKSEALFVRGIHPFRTVGELTDDELRELWSAAHEMLRANRDRRQRVTTGGRGAERFYVYGRGRAGCRVCDNAISYDGAGSQTQRSTYWCPGCQRRTVPPAH